MSKLGILLKDLRGNRSLREVSKATGLSHTYISDLEKGFKHGTKVPINPSADTLKRLSKAYDYDYKELMKVAGYLDEEIEHQDNIPDDLSFKPSSRDKRDLKQMIEETEVMYDGVPLSDEAKQRIQGYMEGMFWEAKEMNKRKKKKPDEDK